ncbi:hypothetical protein HW115_03475 [Verrucomicrobiaceae bacterium N1E253]|uniref:Uncharacterized protein n=1 Tax=Oceaniferula marina TaxID=2748318 RepID=A0A851GB62_9BACT|nr:hypothetical protein [Oceaniferula marina]NWK54656.1 hypothetical protein [Oceaniferula marina]
METHEHDASPQATVLTLTADGRLYDGLGRPCPASSIGQQETLEIMLDARSLGAGDKPEKEAKNKRKETLPFMTQSLHYELVEFLPRQTGQCLLRYRRLHSPNT